MHTATKASSLQNLLADIRHAARHPSEQGRLFERLISDYLSHEPRFRDLYARVQSYTDFVAEQGHTLRLTPGDKGIDLVATTHGGEHHAVQCKCYAPDHTISKPDIDSFMAASGHRAFSARLLIDTTLKPLGSNAEQMLLQQHIPATRIGLDALEASTIDWTRYALPDSPDTALEAPAEVFLKPRNQPRPHQQKAIADVLAGLAQHERGQLIMACGSGKTFTALRIAEAHAQPEGHILFLVPSLALLSQALTEWTQQTGLSLTAFAVCSDSEVGAGAQTKDAEQNDRFRLSLHELAYPATTHAATLAKQHAARLRPASMTVVFSTYHSIEVIERAQKEHGLPPFDLVICDEAHRTTGQTWEGDEESHFVRIHAPDGIATRKRLYMTATPRIYSDEAKKKTALSAIATGAANTATTAQDLRLYSMDDAATYGPTLHTLSFSSAVEQQLLVPYKVIVLTIHEEDISSRIQALLTDENNSLRLDDAAKIIGCFKALAKDGLRDLSDDSAPMRRAVAFCQIIDRERTLNTRKGNKVAARQIAEMFEAVVAEYQRTTPPEECYRPKDEASGQVGDDEAATTPRQIKESATPLTLRCQADYVHGGMGAAEKTQKLAWLKAPVGHESRILTNVRCLSEGVDVPSLDAVLFLSPRNSQVEVVQAVGRVMRRAPGKKRGYIILPIVIPHGIAAHRALNDNKTYRVVWQVLRALKAHDDQLDTFVNRLDLIGSDPTKIEVIDTRELRPERGTSPPPPTPTGTGGGSIGTSPPTPPTDEPPPPTQLYFEIGTLERAILPKIVEKLADRDHWERWAADIARIAQLQISRIRTILDEPQHSKANDSPNKLLTNGTAPCIDDAQQARRQMREVFDLFSEQLHRHINAAISRDEIIEMLAQHLITRPVFDALFGSDHFSQNNPISRALEAITAHLLSDAALDKERQALDGFYADVRRRSSGITTPAARQKLIITLYDQFFASAFPRVVQKHGIVYTPLEVVDFILHSTADLLKTHFAKELSSPEVHILDPFTGTGTFIAKLLANPELIPAETLPRVYSAQLHATEILLLPYYIAAVNIETTYAQRIAETTAFAPYTPFSGILLADTFNIPTAEPEDWVEAQAQDALAANDARRRRQMQSKITVILGNPPYSVGQKKEDDNNKNVAYPALDQRIAATYADLSKAGLKKSLYDSYIRALRWASDRIAPETGGIIGFVTNAGWLDGAAAAGLRHCLTKEFSHLYIFNLRGDIRSEIRNHVKDKKEGGNIFGQGSTTGIVISLLVKEPNHDSTQPGAIHYCDIGDYLSREEKLQKLATLKNTAGLSAQNLWQPLSPDENDDWLNQRTGSFGDLLPLGDRENKNKRENCGIFESFSLGVVTNRDAWCNNPSQATLLDNIKRLVTFYEEQRVEFNRENSDSESKQRQKKVVAFIDTDSTRISWTRALKTDLARNKPLVFNAHAAVPTLYRPFNKAWLYYDRRLNEMVYQMPQIFPLPFGEKDTGEADLLFETPTPKNTAHENRLICVSSPGARSFSVLMCNCITDLHVLEPGAQCFPLYLYGADGTRRSGIQDSTLTAFRTHYGEQGAAITKEAIFHYSYGVLHSPQYREAFANNLLKELPRIPFAKAHDDFLAFERIGRDLAELHINYEAAPLYEGAILTIHKKGCQSLDDLDDADFYVEKMKYGTATNPETQKKEKDLSTIHYNRNITVAGIPLAAYDYVVNGRAAIDWIVERQGVRTDKDSGIVSDANAYATETVGNARYPLELLLRVVTTALKTQKLVAQLPALNLSNLP